MDADLCLEPGEARRVDWTAERYHSDRATVSRSMLVDLIRRPIRYHAVHEARTCPPEKPTAAMMFGTLAHLAVFEWPVFERRVIRQVGRDPIKIKRPQLERVLEIRRAVLEHEIVAALLTNPTWFECTILWRVTGLTYEVDGEQFTEDVIVRVRPDMITLIDSDVGPVVYVPDLKTTEDTTESAFAAACAREMYHLQAAFYRDAVAALFGTERVHFFFIAADKPKHPPSEVACYDLDDADLELGRNQYRAALVDLLRRRRTGNWTAARGRSIHTLRLPRWAYNGAR